MKLQRNQLDILHFPLYQHNYPLTCSNSCMDNVTTNILFFQLMDNGLHGLNGLPVTNPVIMVCTDDGDTAQNHPRCLGAETAREVLKRSYHAIHKNAHVWISICCYLDKSGFQNI